MPVEAKARIVRAGAATTKVLEDLNRQARDALANLSKLEGHPARRQLGEATEILRQYQALAQAVTRQGGALSPPGPVVPAAPPGAVAPPSPPGGGRSFADLSGYGRALTEEERQHYRRIYVETGWRTEAELALARMHGTARGVIAFPRETGAPQLETSEPAQKPASTGTSQPRAQAAAEVASPYTHDVAGKQLPGMVETDIPGTYVSKETEYGQALAKRQALMRELAEARATRPQELPAEASAVALATPPRAAKPIQRKPPSLPELPAEALEEIRTMAPGDLRRERRKLEREVPTVRGAGDVPIGALLEQHPEFGPGLARLEAVKREELRRTNEAERERIVTGQRLAYQQRLTTMGDRELVGEWRTQAQTADVLTRQIATLERTRERAGTGSERQTEAERDLTEALGQRRQATEQRDRAMREGMERGLPRGMFAGGGGGGGRGLGGAFLAGAGIGGGSFGGAMAGAALGLLSWPAAIATMAGLGAGLWWGKGQEYAQTQTSVFRYGMRMGGGFPTARAMVTGVVPRPEEGGLMIPPGDALGAAETYGMLTGRRDIEGVLALAARSQLPASQLAQIIGGAGALGVLPGRLATRTVEERVPRMNAARILMPIPVAPTLPLPQTSIVGRTLENLGAMFIPGWEGQAPGGPGFRTGFATPPVAYRAVRPTDLVRRTIQVREGPEMAGYLAGAYERSAYAKRAGGEQDAFRAAYYQQWSGIAQTAAEGGLPIAPENYGMYAGWLSAASNLYGPDVNPAFAGRLVGNMVRGITQPGNEVAQGAMIRAIMALSDEQKAEIQRATTGAGPGKIPGGFDLSRPSGAFAALQAAAEMPNERTSKLIMGTALGGFRRIVGTGEAANWAFQGTFRTTMPQAIMLNRAAEQIVKGEEFAPQTVGQLKEAFGKMVETAGTEALPDKQLADAERRALEAGASAAGIGQALWEGVEELTNRLRSAKDLLDNFEAGGVPMTPAPGPGPTP